MNAINLIPAARLARRRVARARSAWVAGTSVYAAVLLAVGLGFVVAMTSSGRPVRSELHLVSQRVDALTEAVDESRAALAEARRQSAMRDAVALRPDWSRLLRAVQHAADETITLRGLAIEATDGGRDAAQLAGNRRYAVPVSGYALTQADVSRFVLGLEMAGVFDRVTIEQTTRTRWAERSVVSFEVVGWMTDGAVEGAGP